MDRKIIDPRVLKGFRDFLPAEEMTRRGMIAAVENCFRSFGFLPIDTPVLEYAEILLGKGGGETEKQVYRFTDHGGRDVAMRFDLTVPFARFVAEHRGVLTLPFKRYHIAKVWRGENTQKGRYREFTQCDFDIVGSASAAADFEILLMMRESLKAAGAGDSTVHINHRGLFNRFLAGIGAADHSVTVLRCVDKLAKIGAGGVRSQLETALDGGQCDRVLEFTGAGSDGAAYETVLERLCALAGKAEDTEHLGRLRSYMKDAGVEDGFILDPSITRGLDYYTGIVYESFLNRLVSIGSVCSGGRYDNLTALYSKEKICGVGASIGLDRLQAALEELSVTASGGGARAAVACTAPDSAGGAQVLAAPLRRAGIACEVFFEPVKLTQQFILAEKKGIPWVLVPPHDEKPLLLRNIARRADTEISGAEAAVPFILNRQ
ncbi:MAG: histidine--tRNA ligase [Treponema sp.]|jgi:histidyl-tRNA synthetase|nr:histidine--tRNA ligase [Treponema sp.]